MSISQEELEDFYQMLRGEGWTRKAAQEECVAKVSRSAHNSNVIAYVSLRHTVPLDIFKSLGGYEDLSESKQSHLLWMAGIDVKRYGWGVDVGYYCLGDKKRFGRFAFGQERTDTQWTKLVVGGSRVASWDAQLIGSERTLGQELRRLSLGGQ